MTFTGYEWQNLPLNFRLALTFGHQDKATRHQYLIKFNVNYRTEVNSLEVVLTKNDHLSQ